MPTTTKEKTKKKTDKDKEALTVPEVQGTEAQDTLESKSSIFREGEEIKVKTGTSFAIEVLEGTYVRITIDIKSYTRETLDFHGKVRKQAHKKSDDQPIVSAFRFLAKAPGKGEIILKSVNRPDHKPMLHFTVTITP